MTVLSPGRWRGLRATSRPSNVFAILAFDQRGSYRKMLPAGTSFDDAVKIKSEVVVALSFHVSAVLLDNQYGLDAIQRMSGGSGVLMSLEESGYSGDATYRRLMFNEHWNVAKIKQIGGTAIKLLAYYHPHSGELATEIEGVIRSVADECHKYDLPLFLEPMSYSLDANVSKESAEFAKTRPEVVIETAARLSESGADVLKLEFPNDAAFDHDEDGWVKSCEAVSKASKVPWVLLSAGVAFETFARQTEIACSAGASGWLAGRAIWKECVTMSPEDRAAFLQTTAVERVEHLNTIAEQHSKPWTEFYQPAPSQNGEWFINYTTP
jgi:tagatose 1,6-diphosphate aldolase